MGNRVRGFKSLPLRRVAPKGNHLTNNHGDDPPLADVTGVTPWGNAVTDAAIWHGHDPASLATNLASVKLFVAAGSGIPCTLGDADPVLMGGEALFRYLSQEFDGVLTKAGVAYQTSFPACGVHDFNNWMARLREWWPTMVAALGTPPPATFSYRSTDAAFSVWGWSVAADAGRAPEFLQMSDVSDSGLVLTGSGSTTVTTPPLFTPDAAVDLTGDHTLCYGRLKRTSHVHGRPRPRAHNRGVHPSRSRRRRPARLLPHRGRDLRCGRLAARPVSWEAELPSFKTRDSYWTRSTTGMMAGGALSLIPNSSRMGTRYPRNASNAS